MEGSHATRTCCVGCRRAESWWASHGRLVFVQWHQTEAEAWGGGKAGDLDTEKHKDKPPSAARPLRHTIS